MRIRGLLKKVLLCFQPSYSDLINVPIRLDFRDWAANERLVEIGFVHHHIGLTGDEKRILEFGCARSNLALRFAALGYRVVGIDLRDYPFDHPHLEVFVGDLLDYHDDRQFDYITAISTLEHVGLGAYGEPKDSGALERVCRKLKALLEPAGKLIVTVPCGMEYQDHFLRSFHPEAARTLFSSQGLELLDERYYKRVSFKYWKPCSLTEAAEISNARVHSGITGVNCVGCFAWG